MAFCNSASPCKRRGDGSKVSPSDPAGPSCNKASPAGGEEWSGKGNLPARASGAKRKTTRGYAFFRLSYRATASLRLCSATHFFLPQVRLAALAVANVLPQTEQGLLAASGLGGPGQ